MVGLVDRDVLCAALLHDAWEDAQADDPEITPGLLAHTFGPAVAELVELLSKKPKAGYLERLHAAGNWRAILVKACDRLDNLRSLPSGEPAFVARQTAETRDHYLALFGRPPDLAPPELGPGLAWLLGEITRRASAAA